MLMEGTFALFIEDVFQPWKAPSIEGVEPSHRAIFHPGLLVSRTAASHVPLPFRVKRFECRRLQCGIISPSAGLKPRTPATWGRRGGGFRLFWLTFSFFNDLFCQAVFFPLLLTSLLYGGSFVSKTWKLIASRKESSRENSCSGFDMCVLRCMDWITAYARNVMAWRNYVVAPFTEELVFRACMIPLLLCGGFGTSSIIFLTPVFFSLAHLNHFLELYYQRRYRFTKAFLIVGLQLGYTVIFGWFASFLFIRTGNLISPIVAHVFCNVMGLPVLSCPRTKGLATLAAAAGVLCFLWLLFPATSPYLYNDLRDGCSCWHRYCSWS
ncbi:hypothetical protein ZIOFF_063282 [Zingiber officinale]|uniref:intramembrane prenyl-peptidase Rce1 n=1 Tax=Zingiber officinale TaxID=94328 RepID=A0A8J5F1Z0_ZINOF|nr:hypothetical protein ZIOFF_063282 [Zingiber officinale]